MTWAAPLVLGGFRLVSGVAGIEPISWDGAMFPTFESHWDGETLVYKPSYPMREGEGLSVRALISGLLETMRLQFGIMNLAGSR